MFDVDQLNDDVVACLCRNLNIDPGEESTADVLRNLDFNEAWDRYLTWNGIDKWYGPRLAQAYETLKQAHIRVPKEE